MTTLLHINSSPRAGASKSLAIAQSFLSSYHERHPELVIDSLNLFDEPLPDFGTVAAAAKMAAFGGQEHTETERAAWAEARAVFDRFAAADEYLFNVPMWNHGVPYVLKQWIDLVTQPGWAFGFHPEQGYSALLQDKRAVAVYTTGVYTPGRPPNFGSDFHASFFTDWMHFVGIDDVTEIRFDGNVLDSDPETSLATFCSKARDLATTF
ncbi:NAD(P)H-dependent oxidoreductase [Nocardia sp. NPDC004604]|uniref:FMN-dependent NADH-azoreductase n=1 Tax=Nocardia sp. NPDC004604 TaxID=3157013 RepID=UPI0033BB2EF2